jgi:hypothetical protein
MHSSPTRFRSLAFAVAAFAGLASTSLAEKNGGAYGRWVESATDQIEVRAVGFDSDGSDRFRFQLIAESAAVGKSRVRGTATLVPYPGQPLLTRTMHVVGVLDRRADGTASLRAALAIDDPEGLRLVGSMLGALRPFAEASVAPATADTAPLDPDADAVDLAPEDGALAPIRGEFRARWKMS